MKLLYDVGSLLNQLRSPEHACTWLEQALVIVRTLRSSGRGNDKLEARILLSLGEVCIALSDYTNAVTINKEASVFFGKYLAPLSFSHNVELHLTGVTQCLH